MQDSKATSMQVEEAPRQAKEKPQLSLNLNLTLDQSNQSATSVPPTPVAAMELLAVVPEDKRKSLEERMTKSGQSVVVETVVGFGNDGSRDGMQFSNGPSYTPGGPASPEPGHPNRVTRILCEKSRESAEPSAAAGVAPGPKDKTPPLVRSVSVKEESTPNDAGLLAGHFSAEELDSSDDDASSRSSGDSRSQPPPHAPSLEPSQGSRDADGLRRSASGSEHRRERREGGRSGSGSRKRKLFGARSGGRENSRDGFSKRSRAQDLPSPDARHEKSARPITHFFAPKDAAAAPAHAAAAAPESSGGQRGKASEASPPASGPGEGSDRTPPEAEESAAREREVGREREKQLRRREAALDAKARALQERDEELARREGSISQLEAEARERAVAVARQDVADAAALRRQHDQRAREVMRELLIRAAREERALQSAKLASDTMRVGRVSYYRSGMSFQEVWEEGSTAAEVRQRQEQLARDKETLEKDKKAFQKRCKGGAGAGGAGQMAPPPVPTDEQAEQEEIYRLRAQKLKDRERQLGEEKEKLDREKHSLIRELKRHQDQQRSKYNDFPLLNNRYLLLHLLGKGGFSEVYRAFDLVELCDVACKIHELNPQWKEDKRANYMKHATREYEIQKKLLHQRIVRLKDVFEMTSDAFCTVLEHCDGGDLEQVLKEKKMIGEREARSIIMQVFAGLKYLNEQRQKVIHFDLKPGNILFHNGEVKISDFGLSKVMEEEAPSSAEIELTSQGAGTYWYLPPECFEVGSTPPKISSKVDVWSAGVMFYQMLYGCKPFGHGMSQDHMLRDQTITKSTHVTFPEGKEVPKVSERAKEFIRRCLSYYQHERPSVITVFQDPYLRQTGRQASTNGAGSASHAAA